MTLLPTRTWKKWKVEGVGGWRLCKELGARGNKATAVICMVRMEQTSFDKRKRQGKDYCNKKMYLGRTSWGNGKHVPINIINVFLSLSIHSFSATKL